MRGFLAVVAAGGLAAGCCAGGAPRPSFAGIPEAADRSEDLPLPLDAEARASLVDFLVNGGRRPGRGWSRDDVPAAERARAEVPYAPLLDRLASGPTTRADLAPGGAVAAFADEPGWVLAVHDARFSGEDLDSSRVRGFVRGDFLFAFYWRRLESGAAAGGILWTPGPEVPDAFPGLVVVHKRLAVQGR